MDWKKRNMFSSAVDMQRGGAVPWPGYLYGGLTGDPIMPTQLFEEGDQDINMALNNMASMTNPSLEQIGETEAVSIGPSMEGEMAMDQGPSAEGIKDKYQNIAKQYAMNLVKEGGDMNLFMKQAKQIEIAYANELEKMGEEITPGNQLMTPEFIEEIQVIFTGDVPEMVTGGLTGVTKELSPEEKTAMEELKILRLDNRFTPQMWINASEEQKTKMRRLAPLISTVTNTEDDNKAVMDRLDALLKQRKDLAPQMAYAKPTKQGGILGFATQYNETKALEAAAKDKALEDAMNAIRYGARAGSSKSSQNIPAAVIEDYYGVDTLDKTYKEHMSLQSKGVEGQFDVFSEIPGFIALYGRLPKLIEESYGLGDKKIVQGVPETFYNFYNVHKNITINAWNQLEARGTMGAFKKASDRTPVPQKLIWTRAVEAWNSLP